MSELPTVNDVASAAGVSRQTVSNVLNSPDKVKEVTRLRVQQVISDLGYRPHESARRLRTRRSNTLAVRIDKAPDGVSGAVLDRFLHALTERADQQGLRVMLYAATNTDDEVAAIARLVQGSDVDAFVLTSTFHGDPRAAWLIAQGQRFVTFGRPWGMESDPRYRWVDVDGRLGARAATEHLINLSCRRVAFLGWPVGSGTGDERRIGWRDAMVASGCHDDFVDGFTAYAEENLQAGRVALRDLIARQPGVDGVVATSDTLAVAAMIELGGRLPVVGFDNTPIAGLLGFSSVDQCLEQVASDALKLLDDDEAQPSSILVPPRLVVRQHSPAIDLLR